MATPSLTVRDVLESKLFRAHLHSSVSDSEAVYLRESMYTRLSS
jgi:hypothetical protein